MKHLAIPAFAAIVLATSACGSSNTNTNTGDSALTKFDTVANPADHTNAIVSDSTLPPNALGVDTVAGGKSVSSGRKDTTKRK